MNLYAYLLKKELKKFCLICFLVICGISEVYSQSTVGFLKGKIVDAADNRPIQGAVVSKKSGVIVTTAFPDGSFIVKADNGTQTFSFTARGYKKMSVSKIPVLPGDQTMILVRLFPEIVRQESDTVGTNMGSDTSGQISYDQILKDRTGNVFGGDNSTFSIRQNWLNPTLSKDLSASLAFLPGVNQQEKTWSSIVSKPMLNGMNGRYVNVILNGSVQWGLSEAGLVSDLSVLPTEMIGEVALQTVREASTPGEFGSGNLLINLKDKPDNNFFYLQVGSEFQNKYGKENFFGDKRSFREWSSLPGLTGKLPDGFPGAQSESRLIQKNSQEKSDLLKTLPNTLSAKPIGTLSPANRFTVAWGKNYTLKTKQQIGFLILLNHQNQENIFASQVMVAPNVSVNPYPFSNNNARVIRSYSDNINYQQYSYLNGLVSACVAWNKSKVALSILYTGTNAFFHTQNNSIYKPDEDSLASRGIRYKNQQSRTTNIGLKGDHAFGKTGKFRFEWNIGYNNYKQSNPDERSFLLRQDSIRDDYYQIAQQQTQPISDRTSVGLNALNANLEAIFTNSFRSWREINDHNFTGSAGMSTPVQLFKLNHIMSGGLQMQTQYRELFTDLLLYRGPGFFNIDGLIAPQRYFPGGLEVDEYFLPLIGPTGSFKTGDVNADNYGNYLGSINIGAGYFSNETQLSKKTSLKLGVRFETTSQLVSLFEYHYFEGFTKPEKVTLDENVNISSFDLLPSARLSYSFHPRFDVSANYFRSLNRPRMQELTNYRVYDPGNFMVTRGNRLLEISTIDNIEASFSFKPTLTSFVRINAFYKKIYKPIEYVIGAFAASTGNLVSTPHNMPEATVKAIQGSFLLPFSKKSRSWLSRLQMFGTVTLLNSKVVKGPIKSSSTPYTEEHSLSGSPNYSVNAGLVLDLPKFPAIQIDFDETGDYLTSVGSGKLVNLVNGFAVLSNPNYYSKGRTLMNAQLSQQMFKNRLVLIVGVNNLFAENIIQYQDLNGNKKFDEPLKILTQNGNIGFFSSGIDNTTIKIEGFRSYFIRLSYQFQK